MCPRAPFLQCLLTGEKSDRKLYYRYPQIVAVPLSNAGYNINCLLPESNIRKGWTIQGHGSAF